MRKKFYFNGVYLVKGRKWFNTIKGVIVSSKNPSYSKGDKCSFESETFKEVSEDKVDKLKDWGFIS